MITAMFLYIVMVYLGVAAYALRPLPKAAPKQYVVRTTWTDKQHTTADYMDAWDWVKQYSNVDCRVWINDDIAYEPPPRITNLGALLKEKLKTVDMSKWQPEKRVTPPRDVVVINFKRRQAV